MFEQSPSENFGLARADGAICVRTLAVRCPQILMDRWALDVEKINLVELADCLNGRVAHIYS